MTIFINNDQIPSRIQGRSDDLRERREMSGATTPSPSTADTQREPTTARPVADSADLGRGRRLLHAETTGKDQGIGNIQGPEQARTLVAAIRGQFADQPASAIQTLTGGQSQNLMALLEHPPS